jgi:hypothetical protein
MIIHRNEIMEPEELAELGKLFDEAWAALRATAGQESDELRTGLASILLRLAHLRQLGPDQMKATALRIFRAEPIQSVAPPARLHREAADCSASPPQGG